GYLFSNLKLVGKPVRLERWRGRSLYHKDELLPVPVPFRPQHAPHALRTSDQPDRRAGTETRVRMIGRRWWDARPRLVLLKLPPPHWIPLRRVTGGLRPPLAGTVTSPAAASPPSPGCTRHTPREPPASGRLRSGTGARPPPAVTRRPGPGAGTRSSCR